MSTLNPGALSWLASCMTDGPRAKGPIKRRHTEFMNLEIVLRR